MRPERTIGMMRAIQGRRTQIAPVTGDPEMVKIEFAEERYGLERHGQRIGEAYFQDGRYEDLLALAHLGRELTKWSTKLARDLKERKP